MNKKLLAMLMIPLACSAQAQETKQLKEVTVTATRSEADIDAVPATVTTLDREALDRRLPRDEADLFRDEPDVALARDARRFGATRVNIRGIENNRVVQMVDGVRLPDFYNGGGPTHFTLSGPLPVMTDFMQRVEILRGPASSLYGSDAIGGVVGYLTLDPADLLEKGERAALRYRLGRYGANQGLSNTVLGAFRGEAVEGLIGLSQIKANETGNQGDVDTTAPNRTRPNPQDSKDMGLLAKLIVRPAAGPQTRPHPGRARPERQDRCPPPGRLLAQGHLDAGRRQQPARARQPGLGAQGHDGFLRPAERQAPPSG